MPATRHAVSEGGNVGAPAIALSGMTKKKERNAKVGLRYHRLRRANNKLTLSAGSQLQLGRKSLAVYL